MVVFRFLDGRCKNLFGFGKGVATQKLCNQRKYTLSGPLLLLKYVVAERRATQYFIEAALLGIIGKNLNFGSTKTFQTEQ